MRIQKSTLVSICAIAMMVVMVYAGTGSIRIDPPLPGGETSPAIFELWVQGGHTVTDTHILLVMTDLSYAGLDDVVVVWDGGSITIPKGDDWTKETSNGVKVPPGTSSGAGYTVASLKDHLGTSDPIWWAFVDVLDGNLGAENKTITVTLTSTDPEMLVYILGKSDGETVYDERVPPTIPGFVVPEVPIGTITTMIAMMGALYTQMRSKKPL